MLKENKRGIIGLILLAIVFLLFVIFVGKRVYDANHSNDVERNNAMAYYYDNLG